MNLTVSMDDGRILWAGPAILHALDIELSELVGRSLLDAVDEWSRSALAALFASPPWTDRSFNDLRVVVPRPFGPVVFDIRSVRYFARQSKHAAFIRFERAEALVATAVSSSGRWPVPDRGPDLQPNGRLASMSGVGPEGLPRDELSGLPLRSGLLARLDAAPPDGTSAIVVVDIDEFGRLNARLGASAGDDILAEFGARLAASVRGGDFAARLSGDRFAVLGAVDGVDQALAIAARVERVLAEPFEVDGSLISIGTSIGAAWGANAGAAQVLFEQAEIALDTSQKSGGRQLRFYEPNDVAMGWADLASFAADLRHALSEGHISVAYQPIVDLGTGRLEKLEGLARWNDPDRGVIGPNEFIPLAERSGTIGLLGGWILDRVCADATRLAAHGMDTGISVNMSVAQLRDPAVTNQVAAVLAEHGVDPARMWIEVTESVLLEDSALGPLDDLHDLGLHLVIDDFGTGYATFQYLTRLPCDAVKIDTSFIAGLGIDASDTAIVRSVINLAGELGLQVIAEGVETESQRAQLIALGCRLAQGWLFDRALPFDELLAAYGPVSGSVPASQPAASFEEAQRIAALHACKILDTSSDAAFDTVVQLATKILDAPMGAISLLDSNRQWFKARIGIDVTETSRDIAFCNHAIAHPREVFVVADTLLDHRFVDNPFVTGPPAVRSYAGVPIRSREGLPLGTLCVFDTAQRSFSEERISQLTMLADQTAAMLDLRRRAAELSDMLHSGRSSVTESSDNHVDVTQSARHGATAVGEAVVELTRASERRTDTPGQPANVLRFGSLELWLSARAVLLNGRELDFSAKEFDLLAFLSTNANRAFTRSELLHEVWRSTPDWQNTATVTEHVYRLRSKIESDPAHPRLIRTVRGVGYRFEPAAGESNGEASTPHSARSGELTLAHDHTYVVLAANGGMLDLLMTDRLGDVVGRSALDFVAPSSHAAVQARVEMRASGHVLGPQVLTIRTAHGTDIVSMISSEAAEFANLPAVVVGVREIVDPPKLSRQLVNGVINEVSDAVIVTDPDLHVLSWNPAAERLYGWSEREVLGHALQNVVRSLHPVDLVTVRAEIAASGRWSTDAHHVTRDGTIIELMSTLSVITDEKGAVTAIVSVNRPERERAKVMPVLGHDTSNWSDVQRAVNRNEFIVYYEPVVRLIDRAIVSVNVRVRWLRPDGGTWDLADFIGDVETADALGDLARYVYPTAFLQFEQWHRAGRSIELTIDVSARQLADQRFLDALAPVIVRLRVAGSRLWLLVQEDELQTATAQTREMLHSLSTAGAQVAVGGLRSGWATAESLSRFHVDALAFDSALIDTPDPLSGVDAAAIAALGSELSIPVWVENVGDQWHRQAAIRLGCTSASGPLFGGPTLGNHLDLGSAA
jgi:diguanylate cyclase (GGDEF)-like protein/PAS domain S-box-containing protein